MFTEFMGSIKEIYDDVDMFFDDLIGETSLSDLAKTAGDAFFGEDTKKSSSAAKGSVMFDFDDEQDSDSKTADYLRRQETSTEAIKSIDPKDTELQWINRLRPLAKGQVYGE